MTEPLEIRPGDATADMVEAAWTEILREVGEEGSDARSTVERYGINPGTLSQASLSVSQQEGDFGITFLVIVGAPVAVHVLTSLWDDVVRPRLRAKYGVDGGLHVE
jgi:hypothetical protein